MRKTFLFLVGVFLLISQLASCSSNQPNSDHETISDGVAKEKQILSEDDAEVLVYNELTDEEQERFTVDYMKEEGTTYLIRIHEAVNGEIKVRAYYTVDFQTEKVEMIKSIE
ncbi:hypothetical protein [Guptibacillus hwajinpoensis]|uniref:PepSY domain-containing protein n=1 Tax=Guptibacillus hwajinpoensis TaxID=208199 RepID=A0A0J6D4Q1_9BACL|nr:hypothetical protein [Alkalihalobacillus macyae]KMM39304.1 hypothetical protein AB986_08855 [Alkalihalobacillus macyae]